VQKEEGEMKKGEQGMRRKEGKGRNEGQWWERWEEIKRDGGGGN
jgi:hypothetical protein